jgi:hypothetical protein
MGSDQQNALYFWYKIFVIRTKTYFKYVTYFCNAFECYAWHEIHVIVSHRWFIGQLPTLAYYQYALDGQKLAIWKDSFV